MTNITLTPDWEWADELFRIWDNDQAYGSEHPIFEVGHKEFDPQTGSHFYISEWENVVTIDIDGNILLG